MVLFMSPVPLDTFSQKTWQIKWPSRWKPAAGGIDIKREVNEGQASERESRAVLLKRGARWMICLGSTCNKRAADRESDTTRLHTFLWPVVAAGPWLAFGGAPCVFQTLRSTARVKSIGNHREGQAT